MPPYVRWTCSHRTFVHPGSTCPVHSKWCMLWIRARPPPHRLLGCNFGNSLRVNFAIHARNHYALLTLYHPLGNRRDYIVNVCPAHSTMWSTWWHIVAETPFHSTRKIDATKPADACEQSKRWTKSKIATFRLFRTCERPTECAAHCPKRYPEAVDSVAYLGRVRARPPSQMPLSMWPWTHNLHEEKKIQMNWWMNM